MSCILQRSFLSPYILIAHTIVTDFPYLVKNLVSSERSLFILSHPCTAGLVLGRYQSFTPVAFPLLPTADSKSESLLSSYKNSPFEAEILISAIISFTVTVTHLSP